MNSKRNNVEVKSARQSTNQSILTSTSLPQIAAISTLVLNAIIGCNVQQESHPKYCREYASTTANTSNSADGAISSTKAESNLIDCADLLFAEPNTFETQANGDIKYSFTYKNNGQSEIKSPYKVVIKARNYNLGKQIKNPTWPRILDGKYPLKINEQVVISGLISKADIESGIKNLELTLDIEKSIPEMSQTNNQLSINLPGNLINPSCDIKTDLEWGTKAENKPLPADFEKLIELNLTKEESCWFDPITHTNIAYNSWPIAWKEELKNAFNLAWQWHESGTSNLVTDYDPKRLPPNLYDEYCVTKNCKVSASLNSHAFFLTEEIARKIHISHLAALIASREGKWFSWSSTSDYKYSAAYTHQMKYTDSIKASATSGLVETPEYLVEGDFLSDAPAVNMNDTVFADLSPLEILSFLKTNKLIGKTQKDTILLILAWAKSLDHAYGDNFMVQERENKWQYSGSIPMSAILFGTLSTSDIAAAGLVKKHWTSGCYATGSLLRHIFAALQIESIDRNNELTCGHGQTVFFGKFVTPENSQFYLDHNDNLYNQHIKSLDICPNELLLPGSVFEERFNSPLLCTTSHNIGRTVVELNIKHISGETIRQFCQDTALGKSHQNGNVYQNHFKLHFPDINELEKTGLWERLEKRMSECEE